MKKPPFFVIGCVRSGTTLLRDVLREHPNLASPEETHFFRWSEAFGNKASLSAISGNATLKKHRAMDGITEAEFQEMLDKSVSRSDLCKKYMKLFISKNKPAANRWFDKTPQNVYGAAMIAAQFPHSKFVHIVRNPVDVISSLRIGKIVKVESLVGACNFWNEAAEIIYVLKKAYPSRVYEVKYEDFTNNLLVEVEKILAFVGEDFNPDHFSRIVTKPSEHEHDKLFSQKEIDTITRLCSKWSKHYGFLPINKQPE